MLWQHKPSILGTSLLLAVVVRRKRRQVAPIFQQGRNAAQRWLDMTLCWLYNGSMKQRKPAATLAVRFSFEVLDALKLQAEQHQHSLNGEIIWILREHLEREAKAANKREA
jgi:hypothetical protein